MTALYGWTGSSVVTIWAEVSIPGSIDPPLLLQVIAEITKAIDVASPCLWEGNSPEAHILSGAPPDGVKVKVLPNRLVLYKTLEKCGDEFTGFQRYDMNTYLKAHGFEPKLVPVKTH